MFFLYTRDEFQYTFHMHASLLLFVLLSIVASTTATIQATFSCWFATYTSDATPLPNIVLGYTNNEISSVTVDNTIKPTLYNGQQPTLFSPGIVAIAHVVPVGTRDTILLTWTIGNLSLSINTSELTEATRCVNTVYATQCPTNIGNFCDDGAYCNGNEICFPDVVGGASGVCHNTTEVVVCPDASQHCDNTLRACIPVLTRSPAPTRTPTGAPTVAITPQPTPACQVDSDCASLSEYCRGPFVCNQLTSDCVPADASYDPCYDSRTSLRQYYVTQNVSVLHAVVCNEAARICAESVVCNTNAECSDNLICNGVELCVAGVCHYQRDQSINSVCHTDREMTCDEVKGCVPINEDAVIAHPANMTNSTHHPLSEPTPTALTVVVCIIVIIGVIILFAVIYFEFTTNGSYLHSMAIGRNARIAYNRRFDD